MLEPDAVHEAISRTLNDMPAAGIAFIELTLKQSHGIEPSDTRSAVSTMVNRGILVRQGDVLSLKSKSPAQASDAPQEET